MDSKSGNGETYVIDLACCDIPKHVMKAARKRSSNYQPEGSAGRFNVVYLLTYFLATLDDANAHIVPAIMQLNHSTINAPFCAALGMTKYGIPTKRYYCPQMIGKPLPTYQGPEATSTMVYDWKQITKPIPKMGDIVIFAGELLAQMVCTQMPMTALGSLAVIDNPISLLESLDQLAASCIPLVSLRSVGVLRTEFATLDYDPEDTLLEFVRKLRSIVCRLRCECLALPPPQQSPGPSYRRVLEKVVTSLEGWASPKLLLLQVLAKRFDAVLTDNVVITKTHVESALSDLQVHHHRERSIAQVITMRRMAHELQDCDPSWDPPTSVAHFGDDYLHGGATPKHRITPATAAMVHSVTRTAVHAPDTVHCTTQRPMVWIPLIVGTCTGGCCGRTPYESHHAHHDPMFRQCSVCGSATHVSQQCTQPKMTPQLKDNGCSPIIRGNDKFQFTHCPTRGQPTFVKVVSTAKGIKSSRLAKGAKVAQNVREQRQQLDFDWRSGSRQHDRSSALTAGTWPRLGLAAGTHTSPPGPPDVHQALLPPRNMDNAVKHAIRLPMQHGPGAQRSITECYGVLGGSATGRVTGREGAHVAAILDTVHHEVVVEVHDGPHPNDERTDDSNAPLALNPGSPLGTAFLWATRRAELAVNHHPKWATILFAMSIVWASLAQMPHTYGEVLSVTYQLPVASVCGGIAFVIIVTLFACMYARMDLEGNHVDSLPPVLATHLETVMTVGALAKRHVASVPHTRHLPAHGGWCNEYLAKWPPDPPMYDIGHCACFFLGSFCTVVFLSVKDTLMGAMDVWRQPRYGGCHPTSGVISSAGFPLAGAAFVGGMALTAATVLPPLYAWFLFWTLYIVAAQWCWESMSIIGKACTVVLVTLLLPWQFTSVISGHRAPGYFIIAWLGFMVIFTVTCAIVAFDPVPKDMGVPWVIERNEPGPIVTSKASLVGRGFAADVRQKTESKRARQRVSSATDTAFISSDGYAVTGSDGQVHRSMVEYLFSQFPGQRVHSAYLSGPCMGLPARGTRPSRQGVVPATDSIVMMDVRYVNTDDDHAVNPGPVRRSLTRVPEHTVAYTHHRKNGRATLLTVLTFVCFVVAVFSDTVANHGCSLQSSSCADGLRHGHRADGLCLHDDVLAGWGRYWPLMLPSNALASLTPATNCTVQWAMDGTQSPHGVVGHADVQTFGLTGAMELLSFGELFPFLHLACLATIGHLSASLWPGVESAFLNVPVCSMVTVVLSLIVLILKIVEIVSVSLQHPWVCSLHDVVRRWTTVMADGVDGHSAELTMLTAGSPSARPHDSVVMCQFMDLYIHHLLMVGFLAYVRGHKRTITIVMSELPCCLILEFLGEALPPNDVDYLSVPARTTRAEIITIGAGVLGRVNVRQYFGERQKYLSAKALLAPHLCGNKTLLTAIRVYAGAPRWQLFSLSRMTRWIATFRDINTYVALELNPRLGGIHCPADWFAARRRLCECIHRPRQERARSIRLHMELLVHASGCINTACPSANCYRMKTMLRHGARCALRAAGGCQVCRRTWAFLQIHARQCTQTACLVPRCKDLKAHH